MPPKILAIDDNLDNLTDITALLKHLMPEYIVITTQSGLDGIEKALVELPDAVLLDISMPGVDGFETCRRLKADEKTRPIPVIMITSVRSEAPSRSKGLEAGADAFLSKPIDEYELISQLKVALRIKAAEDALRAEQKKIERLVEAQKITKIGDWEANLITGELHWSQTIFDIFALDSQTFKPSVTAFYGSVHPNDRGLVLESEQRSEQTGLHDVVHRIIRPSGEIRFVHELARRYKDDQGRLIRLHGTVRDITERKQAEAERAKYEAQNRQLQKAESLGRMAGAIAHHFNNQLGAVMGNLEMAMDDLPQGAKGLDSLSEALKASRKAAEVSRLMLTYLGQMPGKLNPLDLSGVCRKSLILLQAASPKGMIIHVDIPASGPVIFADAGHIQQVLTNLTVNAWEAAGENAGAVGLTVKTVSGADIAVSNRFPIDWEPQRIPHACLEVRDTGGGIADKDIDKIFDPFFTTKLTGRGLGLPTVIGIVKAHSGGMTVESTPGRGSVVRVFIPVLDEGIGMDIGALAAAHGPEPPSLAYARGSDPQSLAHARGSEMPSLAHTSYTSYASEPRPSGSENTDGGTVLVVEDEDQLRKMANMVLTRMGYTVLEASDGVEAVEIFKQHHDEIRCVLSDLTMPRMNGWETLAALRKLSPDIPVILSSGYDETQVMAEEHPERPDAFLSKPYQLKRLGDTIRRVITNNGPNNDPNKTVLHSGRTKP